MLKAIIRVSIPLLFLFVLVPYNVSAQIAPTNSATISGSVSDVAGKPVTHATVSLSGSKSASTQTDAQGLFVFIGVPFGTYQISAVAAGLGTAMRSISVQGDTNVAIQYQPLSANGLKVIAQVSSATNATFNVTPASITQVNPLQDAFAGKTSWRTILEQIPGVAYTGSGTGEYALATLPDGPLTPVQISIDGTLPYETATLLDDMPLIGGNSNSFGLSAAGTGTDLSLYPLNAFGAADVVRGPGANAPSIVNSIGGSFVLHAPMAITRNHYDFSMSTDPYGGIVSDAQMAMRWKKLSVVVTYGVNDSPGPISSAGLLAQPIFAPSTVNGQAFIPYSPPCPPSLVCRFGPYLVNPNYASYPTYGLVNGLQVGGVNQSFAWSQHGGSLALNYEFSPSVSAEVFYVGQVSLAPCPEPTQVSAFEPPAGYAGNFPSGEHMLSDADYFFSPYMFRQGSSLLEEKITAQLGRGILRLSALQNRTFQNDSLTMPSSATVRLFGGGVYCTDPSCTSTTPAIFNGGLYTITLPQLGVYGNGRNSNRDLLLNYTTAFGESLHAGVSFVESYYNTPSAVLEQFDGFPIFSSSLPSAVSQTTNEARIFVGGNLGDKTSLDLSMYFANADYHVQNPSDPTGNTYVDSNYTYAAPRLGFVWRPTAAIAVRAAAGGGFAEAPLGDLVGTNAPFCSGSICSVTAPNLNLQPEKSFAFDLGADVRLRHNMVVSFDVYRSNLYGQIYNATSVTGTYLGLPLYTTQYGNLGESRYEGVLLDVRHEVPHGLFWSLSGGLTRGYVVSLPAGFYNTAGGTCNVITGANCTNVTVVPNINFDGQFAGSIPYAQGLGRLGYRWNDDKYLDLVATYYGNNNTYYRPAFVELDGHIGYPLTKNAALLVTFRNITGIYDGAIQTYSLANFSGAPTITGAPYPLWGEEYGPRTVILTLGFHI